MGKQKIECTFAATAADPKKFHSKGYMNIRFTDQFNGVYDTRPIKIDTTPTTGLSVVENANSIQDALEALPNFAIPQVEVDFDMSTPAAPKIDVTFTDGHNTGKQQLLQYVAKSACESGSQPLFRTTAANGDLTCTVARTKLPPNSNYRESATCSN